MKKYMLSISAALLLAAASVRAQDIPQRQVPSVVLNNFETTFPKAADIEWEMDGDLFNVDFETSLRTDHEIWYNSSGKMVKHIEEIPVNALPDKVAGRIKSDFEAYRIDDPNRITTDASVIYTMELKSVSKEDLEVSVDADGKIINQAAD